jgi:hypothetical protein
MENSIGSKGGFNMETIKLGRREVNNDLFIQAVANNNKITDICVAIGFNPTVVTNRGNIENKILELGLNHSHIKFFGRREKQEFVERRIKTFSLSNDNQIYLDEFLSSLAEKSMATYKASCGNFLEEVGEQDFITVTKGRILEFAGRKNTEAMQRNVEAHLRSMMIYCITNNINGAVDKVSKEMLIWLISK